MDIDTITKIARLESALREERETSEQRFNINCHQTEILRQERSRFEQLNAEYNDLKVRYGVLEARLLECAKPRPGFEEVRSYAEIRGLAAEVSEPGLTSQLRKTNLSLNREQRIKTQGPIVDVGLDSYGNPVVYWLDHKSEQECILSVICVGQYAPTHAKYLGKFTHQSTIWNVFKTKTIIQSKHRLQ